MNKSLKVSLLAAFLCANGLFAQEQKEEKVEKLDEVYLSDSKFKLKKENSGKVIYKITKEDIEQNTGNTVIDLLDNIPGVEINADNNAAGSNIGVYFRGGRTHQVAVMIDGVLVSDPTGISASYNLNLIDVNQIESIEVLKGSSSTLYGTGAATGVINITLKKAAKKPISVNYTASIGTNQAQENRKNRFDNLNQTVGLQGTLNKFNYLASYSVAKSDGMSASKSNNESIFETDAFLANNGLVKLGYDISDKVAVQLFGNYNQYTYDYDAGAFADSDINNGEEKEMKFGLRTDFEYNKGKLYAIVSKSNLERTFDSFNSWSGTTDAYAYEGTTLSAEVVNKYTFSDKIQAIVGVNYQDFDNQTNTPFGNISKDVANFSIIDPYLSAIYTSDFGFNLNVGARLNNHSEYGSHLVYNVNPSFNIINSETNKLKVLASYSTAFIAPSTYQLFSAYGNLDLKPEETATAEFGVTYSNEKWLDASAVFFTRDDQNKVIFVTDPVTFASQYDNATSTLNAKGLELDLNIKPINKLDVNLGYTFTEKSEDLQYIPKHKITANVISTALKNTTFILGFKNVGERTASYYDSATFSVVNTTLKSYSLVDFTTNYKVNENFTAFAGVRNIFNEDYEDVIGFTTKGRNLRLGVRLNF